MAVSTTVAVMTATITNGASVSAAVDLGASSICGLIVPASMEGTTLSIQGCDTSGGTYGTLYDANNNPATITFSATRYYYIDPLITAGWEFVKILASTTVAADRAVKLMTRPV